MLTLRTAPAALTLALLLASTASAQAPLVLRGTVNGTDQGRVNLDPETGPKVRTPADSDFSGPDWHTGSVSSGDAFGDAGDGRLVLEFDLAVLPDRLFGHVLEGMIVEDVAVLIDLDE